MGMHYVSVRLPTFINASEGPLENPRNCLASADGNTMPTMTPSPPVLSPQHPPQMHRQVL